SRCSPSTSTVGAGDCSACWSAPSSSTAGSTLPRSPAKARSRRSKCRVDRLDGPMLHCPTVCHQFVCHHPPTVLCAARARTTCSDPYLCAGPHKGGADGDPRSVQKRTDRKQEVDPCRRSHSSTRTGR